MSKIGICPQCNSEQKLFENSGLLEAHSPPGNDYGLCHGSMTAPKVSEERLEQSETAQARFLKKTVKTTSGRPSSSSAL